MSSTALQDAEQDIKPDDNVAANHTSEDTSAMTSAEHTATVISSQQISLDTSLVILTINGTSEPLVVRFPTTTCSYPAKSNCYHILAARMSVDINGESSKWTLNHAQLHKNTCKHPDNTS